MQKNLIIAALIVLPGVFSTSCKKESLQAYSTSNSVYFANYDPYLQVYSDSTVITFAFARVAVTDSLLSLQVNVTGSPAGQDRPYKITVDPSSTAVAGVHYEAPAQSLVLRAGKVSDTITIKLLRAPDLKQNTVRLVLKVQPNEYFTTNIVDAFGEGLRVSNLKHTIVFSDILTQPVYWSGDLLGKFSGKKMALICELGHIEPAFFIYGDASAPPGTREYTIKLVFLGELLKQYLFQQKLAGTPVYYEDGVTEMAIDDY